MATTEDWARIETAAQAWGHSRQGDLRRCILDLRRRMEALEQRAAAPESAPASAADRPLWEQMEYAWEFDSMGETEDWARVISAVADWLAAREQCGAASALRSEARRAREGQ